MATTASCLVELQYSLSASSTKQRFSFCLFGFFFFFDLRSTCYLLLPINMRDSNFVITWRAFHIQIYSIPILPLDGHALHTVTRHSLGDPSEPSHFCLVVTNCEKDQNRLSSFRSHKNYNLSLIDIIIITCIIDPSAQANLVEINSS